MPPASAHPACHLDSSFHQWKTGANPESLAAFDDFEHVSWSR
jgi:hypothetical protein